MKRSTQKGKFNLIPGANKAYTAILQRVKDKGYPYVHEYLLDDISEKDIVSYSKVREDFENLVKMEWEYYHQQRRKKIVSITNAFSRCISKHEFEFQNFSRCVFSAYQDMPLSARGSLVSTRGGRFNIGRNEAYPAFPGYYIANDPITAKSEAFQKDFSKPLKYDASTFALAKNEPSHSIARVRGKIKKVVDLNSTNNITRLVNVLKKIPPSEEIMALSKKLGLDPHGSVSSVSQLNQQLFDRNWSYYPANFGIPHNSQDFGALAREAGVQGMLYNSKYTGSRCLVIFPENLEGCRDSYFEVVDEFPEGVIKKISSKNFRQCYADRKSLSEHG